jgi:hypothetical protein
VSVEFREPFKNLCHGIPVDLIATWCAVDVQTARHWKAGTRVPGSASYKLFALHLDGRILPADWEGYSFRDGVMWDPYGKSFTRKALNLYGIAWQMFREWTRDDASRRATLDDIMGAAVDVKALGAARASNASVAAPEPKASALVRYRRPETVRMANLKIRR